MVTLNTPALLIALPLAAAFLIPLIGMLPGKLSRYVPSLVLLFNTVYMAQLIPKVLDQPILVVIANFAPPLGINLLVGPLGLFMALLMNSVGFLVSLYNIRYIDREPLDRFHMLFLMIVTGATGMVLTGDIFNLFVFMEITSISAYALTGFMRDRDGAEAAFKYLLIGSFSSTFFLLAIGMIYGSLGTLNMAEIALNIDQMPKPLLITALLFMVTALGIESEMFPLNGWAPDAYSEATTPVGAIFGGVVVKAGIYALARMLYTIFHLPDILHFILIMGLITLIMGEMAAIRQHRVKRMLAYSSIGQMGLILIAFGLGTQAGLEGGLFQIFNHAILKVLLFLSAGYLLYQRQSREISDLAGVGRVTPLPAIFFLIGAFGIMGLPPLSGFWSKFIIITETVHSGYLAIAVLALMASIIEVVYYLRLSGSLFLRPAPDQEVEPKRYIPFSAYLPLTVLSLVTIIIGLHPDWIMQMIRPAAGELLNYTEYIKHVLP